MNRRVSCVLPRFITVVVVVAASVVISGPASNTSRNLLERSDVVLPSSMPIFGGAEAYVKPEDVVLYIYEFDLTGDGKEDILTSSNMLKNGNAGGYVWHLYIQREDGLFDPNEALIEFHKRFFFVRDFGDGHVELRYLIQLDNGGCLQGHIRVDTDNVVVELDKNNVVPFDRNEFYVFLDTDYRPRLVSMPYVEAIRRRQEIQAGISEDAVESAGTPDD